ncbi:Na/Pi symporter [Ascidiimonas sp. W6]|uniref:Na/Pi cotransporter family protein n=1 Tax=Ascidiimonas meishanensis TaxID=3128903 RepID=UPI0030EF8846
MSKDDLIAILPLIFGGLVLFLYAIRQLSDTLKFFLSGKAKALLERTTNTIFKSIVIGTLITILLDSSSAVIIIVIILINARTINFKNAIGVIMGANVGTTISSQLIAFNVSKYSVIIMIIGFILWMFMSATTVKKIGRITLYFGLLFFGLYLMELSVLPLGKSEFFKEWMSHLETPVKGAAIGGLVTLIIQSSSATVAMLITLAKQDLINITGALAAMLGAELGTCSDTLLAVIGGTRDALRAGIFHLIFNLVPIVIGLFLFNYFEKLVVFVSGDTTLQRQIANGHILFSILSLLLFLPFTKYMYQFMILLIPDRKAAK